MTARAFDALVVLSIAALLLVAAIGGVDLDMPWTRVRLHDWTRPFVLLVVAAGVRGWMARSRPDWRQAWLTSICTSGMVGVIVAAIAIYLSAHVRVAGGLDSYGYVSSAQLLAAGRLSQPRPLAEVLPFDRPMRAAAPLGYVPSGDGRSSVPRFPLGLPFVMAAFAIVDPRGPFFVPLAMACVAIGLAFALGRRASVAYPGPGTGLLAAVLVAIDPLFAAYAMQPMSDVPATAWLLASIWASADMDEEPSPALGWLAAAGFFGGMAILTRPALAPAVAVLIWIRARRRITRSSIVLASAAAALVALQLALNLALYGGIAVSGYGSASYMFELSGSRLLANIANFGKWLTYSHTALFWLLWPGSMWVLRKDRSAWNLSAIAVAAALPYLFYIVFDDWESSRFLLATIVIVLILTAQACSMVLRQFARRPVHASVMFVLALSCAAASHRFLEREGIYGRPSLEEKYRLVGEWFKSNTSERVVVLSGLHSGTIRMYGDRDTVRWDEIPEHDLTATLRALIDAGREPYLALDLPSEPPLFEARFRGQPLHMEQIARVRVVNIYRFMSAY